MDGPSRTCFPCFLESVDEQSWSNLLFVLELVEYVPSFSPGLNFFLRTLLQHPPMHSCYRCYAFVVKLQLLCFRWKSLQKKENRPRQKDRQLLLLAPPITLLGPIPLIYFFDGTKSEMIVINCLPYQLTQSKDMLLKP